MTEPLFPLSGERAHELVDTFGMTNEPRQERHRCAGVCCRGKNAKGHGPYWFIGSQYVGSDEKLATVLAELRVARRVVAQERDEALAARFELITSPQNAASAGGTRRSRANQGEHGRHRKTS